MTIETVLIAGASGGVGRETVQLLRDREVTVRALTSTAEKKSTLREAGVEEVVVGDLRGGETAVRAVDGVDAVCCTVGSGFPAALVGRELVDGVGVENLARAAAEEGVDRVSLVSSLGVGDSKARAPRLLRLFLFRVLRAKERGEQSLREAAVPHTILRPGGLTDDPATGDVLVGEGGDTVGGTIPRADVARLLVDALWTPAAADRTFEVVARDGLRGDTTGTVELEWASAFERPVGE